MLGHIVVAVTGASGSVYAVRLVNVLLHAGLHVHLLVSGAARQVIARELGIDFPLQDATEDQWRTMLRAALQSPIARLWGFQETASASLDGAAAGQLTVHSLGNYAAGIASGSFLTTGMVICPCSMGTLASIAGGASTNLIHRAADVHLKERRPLVIVPRETPLSSIQLDNMSRLSHAGATILPAMPGYYHQPQSVADLADFIVARICDHLRVPHHLIKRWGDS